jgi:superfamily I DNA/RNA helicase
MITASPTAPDGIVTHLPLYVATDFCPGDAILCRNTAPLITFAFGLINRGVGVTVLGRDIGENLVKTVESTKSSDLGELQQKLASAKTSELTRAEKRGARGAALAAIEDKFACLAEFLRNATSVENVLSRIRSLFEPPSNRNSLLTLSTIHKAKGLEWEHVFVLDFHLIPSRYAEAAWELSQERHLQYVAVTRAKTKLTYIKSNNWKQ